MSASATSVIADVRSVLAGEPVFLAGSLVAEEAYGLTDAHSDVDLFCPTGQVLVATGQKLLSNGYTLDDRFERVWYRWLRYGFKQWHTNSLRLMSPGGVETNLVYKLTEGHPATSLSQVLESFDFGLLGVGYELESDTRRDLRPYLFPGFDIDGPLPMMPNKRDNWRNGFISRYNGLREAGRYVKYYRYGYNMSMVRDDLIEGYEMAHAYMSQTSDPDKQLLGQIYELLAEAVRGDDLDELADAYRQIDFNDSLDSIMEALE